MTSSPTADQDLTYHDLPWYRRKMVRLLTSRTLTYLALTVLAVVFALPLFWMVTTALKTNRQVLVFPPQWIPDPAVWRNFPDAWDFAPFGTYLKNTLIITVLATLGQLASGSVVAYGFARLRFPGRDALFVLLLATTMLPYIVTLVPQFLIFRELGWVNTFLPLIVPYFFGGSPFLIFLMRQYFRSIPMDLSDAARVDGDSEFGIFFRIVLPLALPALVTVAIFSFLAHWNDFLGPLIYLNDESKKTLMLGLQGFIGQTQQRFQLMMAAATMVAMPTIILFFLFQRVFIRSVVLTGMKG
jgi:ABC-type glycerol-3-phosphate transport system permease component